jgi:hypothetical protein
LPCRSPDANEMASLAFGSRVATFFLPALGEGLQTLYCKGPP